VLGNVSQPQLVWRRGGEIAGDEIIVNRWPGLAVLAALLLTEYAPPPVIRLFALDGGLVLSDIVSCR